MDANLRRQMLAYYDERAPEYEEAFTRGTGTASIHDPAVFTNDSTHVAAIVRRFAHGRVIDLACGTGYWLPHYASTCTRITLFDQSKRMLDECEKKIATLGIADRCDLVQGDVFEYAFPHETYDCALVGFLLSHLTEAQELQVFHTLKALLGTSGRFLILDSAWTPGRAEVNRKVEQQQRRLNSGAVFEIYKRYIDRDDIAAWATRFGAPVNVEHFGAAFCVVSGRFA